MGMGGMGMNRLTLERTPDKPSLAMPVLNNLNSLATNGAPSAQSKAVCLAGAFQCIAKRGIHLNALGLILWLSEELRARK
jgi:hypothetical protein